MASTPSKRLVFKVTRHDPELITPSKPTPYEFKLLSDLDDQPGLRFQTPGIFFYPYNPSMHENDPVKVLRESLAKALVYYYPLAGRIREGPDLKLMVECNAEGVLFIEGEADVTLEEFGELLPPFPCIDELLYDVPGTSEIVNCPLLLFQVTRLKCGGVIMAIRLNHTITDGSGLYQFLAAMTELARGHHNPSTQPVWMRHILNARNPPIVTCDHVEYEDLKEYTKENVAQTNMSYQSFFFSPTQLSLIRELIDPFYNYDQWTNFEVLTAFIWRCRTVALQLNPKDITRLTCAINVRNKVNNPRIPGGYYGNSFVPSAVGTTSGDISRDELGHALELVRKVKQRVTEEYVRSAADLMVIKGWRKLRFTDSFLVSDITRVGFRELNFGWGQAAFAGPPKENIASFYIPYKNKKGEVGIIVTMCLPTPAMDRFVKELNKWLKI